MAVLTKSVLQLLKGCMIAQNNHDYLVSGGGAQNYLSTTFTFPLNGIYCPLMAVSTKSVLQLLEGYMIAQKNHNYLVRGGRAQNYLSPTFTFPVNAHYCPLMAVLTKYLFRMLQCYTINIIHFSMRYLKDQLPLC